MSYLRLEFSIDFIHQGVSFRMHKDTFFKCEITTIIVQTFGNSMCKCDQGKAILIGI